jgi:hypothetical protein
MNKLIMQEDAIEVIKSFLSCNRGDEATEYLILAIGAELLDVSVDTLLEECRYESFTAVIYEDDGIIAADFSTYDDKDEAIKFAKYHNWDEVINDRTGEVVWRR